MKDVDELHERILTAWNELYDNVRCEVVNKWSDVVITRL